MSLVLLNVVSILFVPTLVDFWTDELVAGDGGSPDTPTENWPTTDP